MSETRMVRALASFVAFDGKQQNVFNPAKKLANGKTRKATEGLLPADIAKQYVDGGQAEYVAEKPAKEPKGAGGGKTPKEPKGDDGGKGDDDGDDGDDGEPVAGETDAPAA